MGGWPRMTSISKVLFSGERYRLMASRQCAKTPGDRERQDRARMISVSNPLYITSGLDIYPV